MKHWAATFEIPETELMDRIVAASSGKLTRPDPNVSQCALEHHGQLVHHGLLAVHALPAALHPPLL